MDPQPHFWVTHFSIVLYTSAYPSKTLAVLAIQIAFLLNCEQDEFSVHIGYQTQSFVPSQLYYLTVNSHVVALTQPDPVVTQFVNQLLQSGFVFVDVGAEVQSLGEHLFPLLQVHLPSDPILVLHACVESPSYSVHFFKAALVEHPLPVVTHPF